jgi:hypothetical protein
MENSGRDKKRRRRSQKWAPEDGFTCLYSCWLRQRPPREAEKEKVAAKFETLARKFENFENNWIDLKLVQFF